MHIPNNCAVPSVAHLPATAGIDEASASGRAPASISNPSCAPADVNGMSRHQTQFGNARIALLWPSTSACRRGPRRRSCRPSRSSCGRLAGCGRHVDSHPPGDFADIVRIHPELFRSAHDMVVNRAYDRLGIRIHGREGVDDRHPGCRCRRAGCRRSWPGSAAEASVSRWARGPRRGQIRADPRRSGSRSRPGGTRSKPTKWTREAATWPCCGTDPPSRAACHRGRVKNASEVKTNARPGGLARPVGNRP